jgi:hypothetical protein
MAQPAPTQLGAKSFSIGEIVAVPWFRTLSTRDTSQMRRGEPFSHHAFTSYA